MQLCDGSVRCSGNRIFPVHRAIISAVSPYFKALFTNCLNSEKSEVQEISITDAPIDLFNLILDYAYTGTCLINIKNVERLLPFADKYQVLGVVQLCCLFLINETRASNCLGK